MAINEELSRFIRNSLERGLGRAEIEGVLLESGWPADQVRSGLATYAEVSFPIPVPRPKPYVSAREAFVYLVIFSTLYVSAFSLGNLVFALIDQAFPDPAMDPAFVAEMTREVMRWSIALLVVTFPVFALATRRNDQSVAADPTLRLSAVRRWLTYLTLFVAAAFLVGDLATVVYNLLGGEITTRFVLKVVTVAAIAGAVFLHLAREMREDEVAS